MSKRFNNLKKVLSIVSGGFVLVGGFNHIRLSRIDKLIDKLNTVQIHSLDVKDHPVLNEAYSNIVSCIDNISSIKDGVDSKVFRFDNYYVPSFSNDSVGYIIYDNSICIRVKSPDNKYANLYSYIYKFDGSYSIRCAYEDDIEKLLESIDEINDIDFDYWFRYENKFNSITYNFSQDGVLTDSVVSGNMRSATFKYIDGDINSYSFYIPSFYGDNAFIEKNNDVIIHDHNSLNYSFFSKYNDIIYNLKDTDFNYIFNMGTSNIQYKFDSNYKFNGLDAQNDNGEYFKVDGSMNLELKKAYGDNFNYAYSDNKSLRLLTNRNEYDENVVYDDKYDINGLVSEKRNNVLIYKHDENKDYYYNRDGEIERIEENVDGTLVTHNYYNGVIRSSKCDKYTIDYLDGIVYSVNVFKDNCDITINDVLYKLNSSDSLSFENGVLSSKKIGNEKWNYYDGIHVSSYYNSYNNIRIHYDINGNIDGCSYNYLSDENKKLFDVQNSFNYLMENIDSNYRFDFPFSNSDFYVDFSNKNSVKLSYSNMSFSYNNGKLSYFSYDSSDNKIPYKSYSVHVFDSDFYNLPKDVIQYSICDFNDNQFSYSTSDKVMHISNNSKTI